VRVRPGGKEGGAERALDAPQCTLLSEFRNLTIRFDFDFVLVQRGSNCGCGFSCFQARLIIFEPGPSGSMKTASSISFSAPTDFILFDFGGASSTTSKGWLCPLSPDEDTFRRNQILSVSGNRDRTFAVFIFHRREFPDSSARGCPG
jgi:hypothetical protein